MGPDRIGSVLLAALLVLTALSTGTAALAPPQPLCEVCTNSVVEEHDVDAATVEIRVDAEGTGHWTVHYDLRRSAPVDPERLRTAAREALDGHRSEATPRNVTVRVDGDSATVSYDVPRMGHRSPGGVLVVDYFYDHGSASRYYGVNADRVTIRGPGETALTRRPTDANATGAAVRWHGVYGDTFAGSIDRGSFLAFAPAEGPLATAATFLGVGLDIANAKLGDLPVVTALPLVILSGFLLVLFRRGERLAALPIGRRIVAAAAIAGSLAALAILATTALGAVTRPGPLIGQFEHALFSLTLVGALVGLPSLSGVACVVAVQSLVVDSSLGVGPREMGSAGTVLVGVLFVLAPLASGIDAPLAALFTAVVGLAIPLLFLPLAVADGLGRRVLFAGAIVTSPVLVGLGVAPHGGFAMLYAPLLYVPWALATGLVGTIGYTVGLSRPEATDPNGHR